MANTTKGSGKTKKKTSASGTAETDPNNGQKNNGEKEQYRKTYLRHKEKHSP